MVPRGKMLGGSSGINYMAYVRGHPGDFDAWAAGGATGWSYDDVLPYFKKSEGLAPSGDIVVDADAHNTDGPLGVSVRAPVLAGAQEFVDAAVAAGIPDGRLQRPRPRRSRRGRLAPPDHDPRRQAVQHVPRVPRGRDRAATQPRGDLRGAGHQGAPRADPDGLRATGVEYRTADGETAVVTAAKEVVLSAGAVGSPHLLHAVRHRAAGRARRGRRAVPARRSRRRQAPQGPPAGRPCLPGARRRRLDDRDRPVDGSRRAAGAGRAAAGRPGRRRRPARGAPGAQGRGRAAGRPSGRPPDTAWCRRRCTTRAPGSRPASATTTPTTPSSASSSAATTPTSGARCLRVDPDEYFDDPATGVSPPTPRP